MPNFPLPSTLAVVKRLNGADPAANTECSDAVPAGKWWLLIGYSVALVQGATQTPQPILIIDDGTTTILESIGSTAAQGANTTCRYSWGPAFVVSGQVGTGANVHSNAPLPDGLLLSAGWRVRTSTLGLGANSDFGPPSIFVAELG